MSEKSPEVDNEFLLYDGNIITGTMLWFSVICTREVRLISRNITPDSDDTSLEIGRAIHKITYRSAEKEIDIDGAKIDLLKDGGGVICEVKTSSRYLNATRMQLLYYLYRLKKMGVNLKGSILVPKEKKNYIVELDELSEKGLLEQIKKIKEIVQADIPPKAAFIPFCRRCAYRYFCWSK